ncbi:CsgE family curli-type amyloid fiber assembly protein [Halopseudomonas phragmitis]|uniref:Curli production assembly/transport component CsgE n=2 Tax=Pseudomonadaceae TaxID=135621 RepID=A0A1V0B6G2_9GAMM|nr:MULTISPECIES: CsgE family curli-type amyloid fiber assembly protein [Pseudomonadaceae]AQZ95518.1 curli production assembly protein CsgE [Halopseudomonas phragmitis]PAU87324.1 curli production assembly protein CsgE [Pseudomonas sp. WN033]RHW22529.1 curli production assembly protein CsgE [Pseudomonas jilinensis]
MTRALLKRLGLAVLLGLAPLPASQALEEHIGGFIIDQSISHIGHQFYRYFAERIRDGGELEFNLVIRERPSARWGSLIWVERDGRVLYHRMLAPNTAQLQLVAHDAADSVLELLLREDLESLLYDTFDMERDEL